MCGPSVHITTVSLLQQWGKASLFKPRGPIQTPVCPSLLQQHAIIFLGKRRNHRSFLVMMMADVSPFLPSILCYPHSLLLCACQSMPGPVLQLWCCSSPDWLTVSPGGRWERASVQWWPAELRAALPQEQTVNFSCVQAEQWTYNSSSACFSNESSWPDCCVHAHFTCKVAFGQHINK